MFMYSCISDISGHRFSQVPYSKLKTYYTDENTPSADSDAKTDSIKKERKALTTLVNELKGTPEQREHAQRTMEEKSVKCLIHSLRNVLLWYQCQAGYAKFPTVAELAENRR